MKTTILKHNRLFALTVAMALALSLIAAMGLTSYAAESPYQKISDASTVNGWKEYFGNLHSSTENAGAVWTDKSVFDDTSAFENLKDANGDPISLTLSEDGFLVALSAIASNKSIVGYSHLPTDTFLVLDMSSSMGTGWWGNDAVEELVMAANAAVDTLLNLNKNNRIGVILYAGSASGAFLPMDRYTATQTTTYSGRTIGKYFETNRDRDTFRIAQGVSNSEGPVAVKAQDISSGTYIQGGLGAAETLFEELKNANDTVVQGDGFQSGTTRKPVVLLMSDGSPTVGSTHYSDPTEANIPQNRASEATYAFLTQLTGAAIREKISDHYGSEVMIYTLGMNVGNASAARSVLDPKNSIPSVQTLWNNYKSASVGATYQVQERISITKSGLVTDINYTDGYYAADSASQLFQAFDAIVNEIIIQSLYRPTLVEQNNAHMEGYVEFIDDIGDYLAVKKIDGILIGNTLYTGEKLAQNFRPGGGNLGTVTNPNALGDNLIWAIKERLNIADTKAAQTLVTLAYEHGQLSYTDEGNYSNYIGWYADENGSYLGFWDEATHTPDMAPAGAKYVNKSYGMLGAVKDGLNESDLMYLSIQVHREIATGHSQLIFRIPASLIPVVTYEVSLEGTGYHDATNIEMTINETDPLRLLFEVGLREGLNEYTIQSLLGNEYRNADGTYTLYTNAWSREQFNKNNTEYVNPSKAINTVAFFEPSLENERYYYTEPTPVYVKNGEEYVKYSNTAQPSGNGFYRQINVFELTEETNDGNAALHKKIYEPISAAALAQSVKNETDNGWNIPKNVIHRVYDHVEKQKVDKTLTNTLDYSFFPSVEQIQGVHYYADAILGNNGKLTVTPVTGLKITKTVDETLAGYNLPFTFTVTVDGADGTYPAVKESADGTLSALTDGITFANGTATVELYAGESVYLTDLPEGDYTVTEAINGPYEVKSSQNTAGRVETNQLKYVSFVNALQENGHLVITKQVEHPFASDPAALAAKEFTFRITLEKDNETYPDSELSYHYTSDPSTEHAVALTETEQGYETQIVLSANQSAHLEIREGWTVSVEEINLPQGFTQKSVAASENKEISVNHNVVYNFVNEYSPAPVSAGGAWQLSFTKNFEGRPWTENDEFVFLLQQYDPASATYVEIGRESVSAPANGSTVSFGSALTQAFKSVTFSKVGTYHFSVTEAVPEKTKGITYDQVSRDFNVIVTDNDVNGSLEFEVVAVNNTTVSNETVIGETFHNFYRAQGIAELEIQVEKTVAAPEGTNYSPEGFEFALYQKTPAGDTLVGIPSVTDENGHVRFLLAYDAKDVTWNTDKVYRYVIKETKGTLPGMTYADDVEVTVTVKDNLDGTISATADVTETNDNGDVKVGFVNQYNPDNTKTSVTVNVDKTVDNQGTASIGPENFEFVLVGADDNTDFAELKKKTDVSGKVSFELNYTEQDIGKTYTYTLSESVGDLADVQYDETVYTITVTVGLDETNKVIATVLVNGEKDSDNVVEAAFVNIHTGDLPTPTPDPDPKPDPIPENPSTSDSKEMLPLALLLASVIPVACLLWNQRKKRKEQ